MRKSISYSAGTAALLALQFWLGTGPSLAEEKKMMPWTDLFAAVGTLDGPYNYKSAGDPVGAVGWVNKRLTGDEASFMLCSGKTIIVKTSLLEKVNRSCAGPGGSWYLYLKNDGTVGVTVLAGANVPKQLEIARLDPAALPTELQSMVSKAKPGDHVGIAYSSDGGKLNAGIFDRAVQ